ncbi:MAG: histidine phosphatase family protein [Gemmataceae bacterium]
MTRRPRSPGRAGCRSRSSRALHERRVGPLSGTPAGGPEGPWPDTLRRWVAGETDYAPPGAGVVRRHPRPRPARLGAADGLHEGKTLVVVAHGIVIRVLLLSLLPGHGVADWKRLGPIRNVAVHELVCESEWRAERLNELPPGLAE